MVVLPDADLEQAANAFLGATYGVASQRLWRCLWVRRRLISFPKNGLNKTMNLLHLSPFQNNH